MAASVYIYKYIHSYIYIYTRMKNENKLARYPFACVITFCVIKFFMLTYRPQKRNDMLIIRKNAEEE